MQVTFLDDAGCSTAMLAINAIATLLFPIESIELDLTLYCCTESIIGSGGR